MKQLKSLFSMSKTQAAVAASATALLLSNNASAADVDFSSLISDVASTGAVAAIVAMGVVKIAPNFAKWAINKVSSFF
ncbi:hypothetical protein SAMN05444064_105265 [Pseudomonas syringae]|uniref:hypothetical protein n=1 Tax=Pseudomonas syringae TaxID=317 RepID=UPI0008963E23|nr:hypothetical protein [Pseudomonas syringae]SDW65512.1 hypothetical protein SAMN05444514_105255 [Pseudomonas syringae]SDW65765.1 hypothetical protein SAMN05444514_105265 [Pseudomonas syringae]SFL88066.1 hypothetical protein SAMN05444064_105255 [Pseudomonas syringae]SFL88305.1 hypothetical protein SAMN05444064_105265 [Pseudomonas syringae]